MLQHLYIENYVLIKHLEIDFRAGFTVITGETGAGKSILLGALGLVLGQRTEASVLFDQNRKCIVEAVFDISDRDFSLFFAENELDPDPDKKLILRREVVSAGKSRAFINDTPVALSLLKEIGAYLVDIHSQHQSFSLRLPSFQMDLLDGFIARPEVAESYKAIYARYKKAQAERERLLEEQRQLKNEQDYARFLFEELSVLKLSAGEQEELEISVAALEHVEAIKSALLTGSDILESGDSSMISLLENLIQQLKKIAVYYPAVEDSLQRLETAKIDMRDIASDFGRWEAGMEADPAKRDLQAARLDQIYRLESKHQVRTVGELLEIEAKLKRQLDTLDHFDQILEESEKELSLMEADLEKLSADIHLQREKAASELRDNIEQVLSQLGMASASFIIQVSTEEHFNARGKDKVEFLFNANIGGVPQEIAKVASGGELSRLMLAMKAVVHHKKLISCLLLDEIDTGVSGEIAGRVAQIMKKMSRYMQVIAISHLPQIAAKAEMHLRVSKAVEDGRTLSGMRVLTPDEHLRCIASMMSDTDISSEALEAAKVLIDAK